MRDTILQMDTCIFCDIIAGKIPASIVHRDDVCIAFMDIKPINPGHLLIIPINHATYIADMDAGTAAHLMKVAHSIAPALRKSGLKCEGVNLFLADGEAAGQEVFHVHLHVIPRFKGDGFGFTFGPEYVKLPGREELARNADRIKALLVK
jgi:histidine triad (HIT) family protein